MAWVYVHCPKTGGTSVTSALRRAGADVVFHGHRPAKTITHNSRHVFGTARNPWDWYVSWYVHNLVNGNRPGREALAAYGGGSMAFKDVLFGATMPTLGRVPLNWGGCFGSTKSRDWDALQDSGAGLCTFAHEWMYTAPDGSWIPQTLIHTDRLSEGLQALTGVSINETKNARSRFPGWDKPVADYYDAESAAWVAQSDAVHNARLGGWTHPGGAAIAPLTSFAQRNSTAQFTAAVA